MLVECARIGLARMAVVLADVEQFDGIVTDIVERLIIDDDLEEASLTAGRSKRAVYLLDGTTKSFENDGVVLHVERTVLRW